VAEDLRHLDGWVHPAKWPLVACPACIVGHLAVKSIETVPSTKAYNAYHRGGNPMDLEGTFYGVLECALPKCKETVVVAGDFGADVEVDEFGRTEMCDAVRLRYANPPLRIMAPPPGTPQPVLDAIESAAQVIWTDPSASANRLRVAVEELLTAYKVPRYKIVNHKRRSIRTHDRIRELAKYEPDVAETVEAVKWIGNEGSHQSSLTATDVLDGAELLNHALILMYDTSDEKLRKRVREINKKKRLPRKRT
jgi:hypothetical protein